MERKKINFTAEERGMLMELARKYREVLENKKTDSVSVHRKKVTWMRLADDYNSQHGVHQRTAQQLKKC